MTNQLQVIKVTVPPTTKWQPNLAEQLMVSLFSFSKPIVLGIVAEPNKIYWYLEVTDDVSKTVTQTIYSHYPQAEITVNPKTSVHIDYRRYPFQFAIPFIVPLRSASDFGGLDPLTTFVSSVTHLNRDERIVYELYLTPPNQKCLKLGNSLLKEWAGGVGKITWKDWESKLASPLKEARLAIKIKTHSVSRGDDLASSFWPALAPFVQEGGNELVKPNKKSFQLILCPGEVAALWHLPTDQIQTPGIVWAGAAAAPIPNQLIHQDKGITLGTNIYQGRTHQVRLPYEDRVTHVNLIGRTRVGKSTLIHHMVHQDIAAGKGVAVIDPHGDLIDTILTTSIPKEREQDVVLFDTRDEEYPIGLNLLATQPGVSQEATAGYALVVMRKLFAEQWSGGRMEIVLDAALRALVAAPETTVQDIPKFLLDPKFRRQILKHVTDPSTLDFWYDEYELESPAQQKEFARPINHRIRKFYRDPIIRRIVCQQSSLNVRNILDKGQILLANLGGVSEVEAETMGALLISKIQIAAMSRGDIPPEHRTLFYLYIDEVQNFIATSLPKMFSEAGKYGLSLTVANQYLKQLEGSTLEALMGNVGTTFIFRLGPQDARAVAPFVKPQFTTEDLTNLDRFATVVKMQLAGETLPAFSMTTQRPLSKPDDADKRIEWIRQHSRKTYGRAKDEVDAELMSRYQQGTSEETDEAEESYFD